MEYKPLTKSKIIKLDDSIIQILDRVYLKLSLRSFLEQTLLLIKKDINLFFESTLYKQNKTQNIPHKLLSISCILYIYL